MFFADSLRGIAVGGAGSIIQTKDGGKTWVKEPIPGNYLFFSVYFSDKNNGTICGAPSKILRTTDGGDTWVKQTFPNSWGINLWSVHFSDNNHGCIVGGIDEIYMTKDGGNTWVDKSIYNNGYNLNAVYFTDSLTGVILVDHNGGTGEFLKTTDGGGTWSDYTVTECTALTAVWFSDPLHGTAVGNNGCVFRTTNGGVTFINNEKLPPLKQFTLSQNYPNPFNPSTTIKYSLPKPGNVKLSIYNSIGSKVATLVDEYKPAGDYSVEFNGSNLASGIYLYRLESGNYNTVKKFVLIK
jgi:photosystem II stability/assembly factor-like uncharacterized protein